VREEEEQRKEEERIKWQEEQGRICEIERLRRVKEGKRRKREEEEEEERRMKQEERRQLEEKKRIEAASVPRQGDQVEGGAPNRAIRPHLFAKKLMEEYRLVMSNQRFFKIVCFLFPTNIPEKIKYIRF
jgi:hypothetical protein